MTRVDSRLPQQLRALTLVLVAILVAIVFTWRLMADGPIVRNALLGILLTVPLWPPLYGIARGERRTHAWGTLCVIPYFVLGVTEAIANPDQRLWSGLCLVLALALFVTLIAYLRVTREPA